MSFQQPLPADEQVVFVGFNSAYLRAIEGRAPTGGIVVLEEPDIIRKRSLAGAADAFDCLDRIVPVAYQQSSDVLEAGAAVAGQRSVAAVVPGLEYAVPAAAALAAELGLPGATEPAAQALRDKIQLRQAAEAGGVRNPDWREVHGPDDVLAFAGGRPVVLKPANRQASVGVVLLDAVDPVSTRAAWEHACRAHERTQVPDRELAWRYMVEERLRGPEFSVEALVRAGSVIFENVTAKTVVPGPYPVELGHLVPAPLERTTRAAFAAATRSLVAAIGFDTGILHAEWILTEHGPTLVECAGRCPGDHVVDLIDLAWDTRLRFTLIDLLAGRPVTLPAAPARASAIRFLAAEPGTVVDVIGVDAASRLPGVHDLSVEVTPGDPVGVWASSWDRCGHVLVTGADPADAQSRAVDASAAVHIATSSSDL
ncbi:ATP-grasp domain-containing protein [Geodermatophilus sp. CPCC 205506]|uniref:ATP-grasp domain-containing protein n=1 Tax=Geodermatophilus sp. CPCC 205506 TaxID=2936596 RepID=UPI003EEBF289